MSAPFRMEPLGPAHDRSTFSCGQAALDRYFQTQATQDIRRRLSNCFVAVETASGRVAAYNTMASTSIPITELPSELANKLPRYPVLPAVLIGRLAVDRAFQGRKLGAALPSDALQRTLDAAPAAYALLVDAKDDSAAAFYCRYGFNPILGRPMTLFLPIATGLKTLS